MKAKDTVMKPVELDNLAEQYPCLDFSFEDDYQTECEIMREAQAKISFKAGYKEGLADREDAGDQEYKAGKLAGIREVVEWLHKHSPYLIAGADLFAESAGHEMSQDISYYPNIKLVEWQAKLKEWEVKDVRDKG